MEVVWMQKRAELWHLLREVPGLSNRQLAHQVGMSPSWIRKWKKRLKHEDRRYPLTEGDKPTWFDNLVHLYIVQLFLATPHDPFVARILLRVLHMLQHPLYLIHPRVLWGIIRVRVKRLLKKI